MSGRLRALAIGATAALLLAAGVLEAMAADSRAPRESLFIGLDTSGSFSKGGYEDALAFLAFYMYGRLNGLGGLTPPRELFVAAIGGKEGDEAKAFLPVHDFTGKNVADIEKILREKFPPTDKLTDFNVFFKKVARIAKERNLLLTPITVMIVSDGVPDVASVKPGSEEAYRHIDLSPLEYLARRVTVRLAYASPPVGERWRSIVPRQRVRLWTVDHEVMKGWRTQVTPDAQPAAQDRLWKWVRENVDYRARRGT